jgi:hypothetical protein
LASLYLDFLISAFLAWIVCFTFHWESDWSSMLLVLLVAELFWCRDRLHPTVGEFCLGIRYLTSSSSHVVADIKVVNPKLKLNDFILMAGIVEISLAFFFLCGWTFFNQVVFLTMAFGAPLSMVYWVLGGLLFFVCGASFLSASKNTTWIVPLAHVWFCLDLFKSADGWVKIIKENSADAPSVAALLAAWPKATGPLLTELFCLLSAYMIAVVFFSRRHWTH